MVQLIKPRSKIKIVPKDGELEITLNINITIDGAITGTQSGSTKTQVCMENEEKEADLLIPDFTSGVSLNFGKENKL
jgi:hypothetical protein